MSNTHTPGPWRITTDFIGIYDSEGRCIADMDSESAPEFGESETLANARLIAEAPAMLEALRFAVKYMGPPRNGGQREALEAFRTIIARIDGEADQAQAEGPAAEPTAICCTACGSTSVGCDAYARWDGSEWELSSTFDDTICDACGYESSSGFEEVKQSELRAWREERGFDADALEKEGAQ